MYSLALSTEVSDYVIRCTIVAAEYITKPINHALHSGTNLRRRRVGGFSALLLHRR